jgi:NitT/TauT family transport system permease protein
MAIHPGEINSAAAQAAQADVRPEDEGLNPLQRIARVRAAPTLLALVLGIAVWQLLTPFVPSYMLPDPARVGTTWLRLLLNGSLVHHVATTLSEAVLGFLLAFVVGVSLAYPLARSQTLSSLMAPFIAATQATPMVALAPLLVVWFGLGLSSKVIICALIVFFPILVNTMVGLRSIDREMLDAAKTLGAGLRQTLWYVEVPLALRTLLGGIRMGLTLAMTGAVVGEFVAADSGLGFLMVLARTNFDPAVLFAAAITMASLSILAYTVIGWLEQRLIDW